MVMLVVIVTLGAESFIQKKTPAKKQPNIKQEDIVMGNGEALIDITCLLKEVHQFQEIMVNDAYEIGAQKKDNWFSSASQQEKREYMFRKEKIQNSIKECTKSIREEYLVLKTQSPIK